MQEHSSILYRFATQINAPVKEQQAKGAVKPYCAIGQDGLYLRFLVSFPLIFRSRHAVEKT